VLLLGIAMTCVSCWWLCAIAYLTLNSLFVIVSAVLMGAGGAVLLVSSISMATDIIGPYSVCIGQLHGRSSVLGFGDNPLFPFPPSPSLAQVPSTYFFNANQDHAFFVQSKIFH